MEERPEIYVLAGPNGAGKTTVAARLLPAALGVSRFVNADFIAQGLSPHAPQASALGAGRIMLRRIRELLARRCSFGFETTLASRTFAPLLRRARRDGAVVHIVFVHLESPDLAVQRVRIRVERGGHDVPEATIRRRYDRGIRNFFALYRPLADSWSVCDNSGTSLTFVARGGLDGVTTVMDAETWARVTLQGTSDAG